MDYQALWKTNTEAWEILERKYEPAIQSLIEQSGLDGRGWGLLIAALTFEPENTTPAHLMVRNPYSAADLYLSRLRTCASGGFLEEVSEGEFHLTDSGRAAVDRFINKARSVMALIDPLAPGESSGLADLYRRLIEQCLHTPPPPQTWSINLSYKLIPAIDPPLPFIEQAMSCLNAYRDDAHLAAWQRAGVTAFSLEILTLLWRKEAGSIEDLAKKLAFRGHSDRVLASSLDELRNLKYIRGSIHKIELTEAGRTARDKIEATTDKLFFTAWACLDSPDTKMMGRYLGELIEGLKDISGRY